MVACWHAVALAWHKTGTDPMASTKLSAIEIARQLEAKARARAEQDGSTAAEQPAKPPNLVAPLSRSTANPKSFRGMTSSDDSTAQY